jgi:tetratricopeptide (TPR) repeat protein
MYRRQIEFLIGMVILLAWAPVTLAGTVSEEARRFMSRGMAAVEMAKTPKDYERAVREFEQAAELAPDWPDVYFNLGSVQAKAGNYGEAVRHYKRYLELAPNASDAAKVRNEIYKLEYRAEQYSRVSELGRNGRFISYDNGTVLDTQTKLMWAAKDNGADINWQDAKSYCDNYSGGGYTDWRMPTQDELAGLYDSSKTQPGSDPRWNIHMATELINITGYAYWSQETRDSEAAIFSFFTGTRVWGPQSGDYGHALPVRSGI